MTQEFTDAEKWRLTSIHHHDQGWAIVPSSLRALQGTRGDDGKPLFTRSQRREYIKRAEKAEAGYWAAQDKHNGKEQER